MSDAPKKNAADFLVEIADIYRERKPLYGDNYKHVGKIMQGLFPAGLSLETEEDWNRLHLVFHLVSKLTRYSQNIKRGGHQDSLDDLAVYAMLSRECDADWAASRDLIDANLDGVGPVAEKTKGEWGVYVEFGDGMSSIFGEEDLSNVNVERAKEGSAMLSKDDVQAILRGRIFESPVGPYLMLIAHSKTKNEKETEK